MKVSIACIDLIKRSEGCRLTAYSDAVGVRTIGWGHACHFGEVFPDEIPERQAEDLLSADIERAEWCVNAAVKIQLEQREFDALVDFVFNLGCGAFKGSTLLRLINLGDLDGAAEEFHRWVHAGTVILPGLVERRRAERAMFRGEEG